MNASPFAGNAGATEQHTAPSDRAAASCRVGRHAAMDMRIHLSAFGDTDLPLLRGWLYEDHVARWYEHPENWLYEVENRNAAFSWIHHFIARCDGVPIGFCQYYEYCRSGEAWHGDIATAGAYSIDYLIGNAQFVGKGFGKEMILALLAQLSACADARLVIVQPEEQNKASCGALLSAGFVFDETNRLYRFDLSRREAERG